MVIQRSFKTLYDYQTSFGDSNTNNNNNNIISSNNRDVVNQTSNSISEDSNSSIQNNVTSPTHAEVKKFVTTMEMANDVLTALKKRCNPVDESAVGAKTFNKTDTVLRALELLRNNVQNAFDKEIDEIVKKYLNIYFLPAFENIKNNCDGYCGSDEVLDVMKCALIENSKFQYNSKTDQPRSIFLLTTTQNISTNLQKTQKQLIASQKPEVLVQTTSTTSPMIAPKTGFLKRSFVGNMTVSNESNIPNKRTVIVQKGVTSLEGITQKVTAQRRQIYWNTANISTDTYFVLDVQANQAFDFSPDGRERLASKHPELIRYLPDVEDRDWFVQQKIIPSQNRNSRFLLLVYDEVMKLGNSDLYKSRENLNLQILQPFTIPVFTVQKMKTFFIDLNIKSRGLITNSYTTNSINIHSLNGSSDILENFTLPTTNIKITNNSQLRNALLQTQRAPVERNADSTIVDETTNGTNFENQLLVTVANAISSTGNEMNPSNQKQQSIIQAKSHNQVVTSVVKSKGKSVLSSSHATLTALLTNNNNFGRNNNFTA